MWLTLCNPMDCSTPGLPVITNFWSLLKLTSIESVVPSSYLMLCHPLLLLPSSIPSIGVFSNESVLPIRWPKYWSFRFSIRPSDEYLGKANVLKALGEARWEVRRVIFRQPWSRSHLIGYLQYFCCPSSIPSQVGLTLLFQIPHPCLVFLCHTKHRISHTKLRVPLSLVSRSQDPFLYIFSRLLPISISDVLQLLADRIWHFTVWAMWVLKFHTKHRGKGGWWGWV